MLKYIREQEMLQNIWQEKENTLATLNSETETHASGCSFSHTAHADFKHIPIVHYQQINHTACFTTDSKLS
jgi:hypothetical protein